MILWIGHVAAYLLPPTPTWLKGTNSVLLFDRPILREWSGTWIELQMEDKLLPTAGADIFTYYVRSINWAIPTLVVVVIGCDKLCNVETFYVSCIILFGLTVNALIIGSIVSCKLQKERQRS